MTAGRIPAPRPGPWPVPKPAGRSLQRDEVALRLQGIAAEFAQLAQDRTEIHAAIELLDRQLRAARQRDQALEAQMSVLARRMSLLEPLAGPGPGWQSATAAPPPPAAAPAPRRRAAPKAAPSDAPGDPHSGAPATGPGRVLQY